MDHFEVIFQIGVGFLGTRSCWWVYATALICIDSLHQHGPSYHFSWNTKTTHIWTTPPTAPGSVENVRRVASLLTRWPVDWPGGSRPAGIVQKTMQFSEEVEGSPISLEPLAFVAHGVEPKIMAKTPQIIPFVHRVFHEINHPFWVVFHLFLETTKKRGTGAQNPLVV